MNFCHPRAWVSGFAAFALVTIPGLIAISVFGNYNAALVVMVLSILAVIMWAQAESSKGS